MRPSQWHMWTKLAAYSCGGSPGFALVVLRNTRALCPWFHVPLCTHRIPIFTGAVTHPRTVTGPTEPRGAKESRVAKVAVRFVGVRGQHFDLRRISHAVRSRTKLAVKPTLVRDHVQEVWQNLAPPRRTRPRTFASRTARFFFRGRTFRLRRDGYSRLRRAALLPGAHTHSSVGWVSPARPLAK